MEKLSLSFLPPIRAAVSEVDIKRLLKVGGAETVEPRLAVEMGDPFEELVGSPSKIFSFKPELTKYG